MNPIGRPIKSTEDFNGWLEQTKQYYLNLFPDKEKKVSEFINYIRKIYANEQRVFLTKSTMWYLYSKKKWAEKNNQQFWYAIIGKKGGEGKSWLNNHILRFLDKDYNEKRICKNYDDFLFNIYKYKGKEKKKRPSISLDEPETKTHSLSKKGREILNILEKIRILHLYVGCCANSLTSIPPFIWDRIGALIHINNKHTFWLYDNDKDKPFYTIIEDIKGKDGWGKFRHSVFEKPNIRVRAKLKNQKWSNTSLIDIEKYEASKEEDVLSDIQKIIDKSSMLSAREVSKNLTTQILKMKEKNPKLTYVQIGKRLNLSREWVNKLAIRGMKREARQI